MVSIHCSIITINSNYMKNLNYISALLFIVTLFFNVGAVNAQENSNAQNVVISPLRPILRIAETGGIRNAAQTNDLIARLKKTSWKNVESGVYKRMVFEHDDNASEIIRQHRILAAETTITEYGKLSCISKEEATAKNITAEAYDSYMGFITRQNQLLSTPDKPIESAVYMILFPDNANDPDRDVVLCYPKR